MKYVVYISIIFLFAATEILPAQVTEEGKEPQAYNKSIDYKLLKGHWESMDKLRVRIEFIELRSEVVIKKGDNSYSYTFPKDSLNRVYVSGFIANWPPYDCLLKLVNQDTLELAFSQMGITHSIMKYVRVIP
jgi:hypothetical protein